MAVVDRNSNIITNAVASPQVINNPQDGAPERVHETLGLVTPAADDSANSIHRFVRVPSNARISQLLFTCAIAGTAGAVNVGVYRRSEDGGAVVDVDFFASAVDLSAAALTDTDLKNESTTNTPAKQAQPLWEAVGESADPHSWYDIAWTISTTFNGGPTAALCKCRYVV